MQKFLSSFFRRYREKYRTAAAVVKLSLLHAEEKIKIVLESHIKTSSYGV